MPDSESERLGNLNPYKIKYAVGGKNSFEMVKLREELNANTAKLIDDFCAALKERALDAQINHGYRDDWKRQGWDATLRNCIRHNMQLGNALEVAFYLAVAWRHGWALVPKDKLRKPSQHAAESEGASLFEVYNPLSKKPSL